MDKYTFGFRATRPLKVVKVEETVELCKHQPFKTVRRDGFPKGGRVEHGTSQ